MDIQIMKWVARILTGLLVVFLVVILIVLGIGWFIAPDEALKKSDAIVVVSGGDTKNRTDEGIRLYKDGWAPRLVLAGAARDGGVSNAAVMRQQAIDAGVPGNATFIEERSENTLQNAEYLKPVFDQNQIKSAVLVSSPYHTRRVKTTFFKEFGAGYTFIAHPAKDTRWARSSWWQESDTVRLTWDELRKTMYVALWRR